MTLEQVKQQGTKIATAKAGDIYQVGRLCYIVYTNGYAGCMDRISPRQSVPLVDGSQWIHPRYKAKV